MLLQVIIKTFEKEECRVAAIKNEHKQGCAGLQAISVTLRPQPYTAVICRSMVQEYMLHK